MDKMDKNFEEKASNISSINISSDVKGNVVGQIINNFQVNQNRNDEDVLIDLVDQTQRPMHFNHMSSEKKISDVFVDGCYKMYVSGDLNEEMFSENPKLDDCIEALYNQKVVLIEGEYGSGKTILTKRIQNQVMNNKNTLFLNAGDILKKGIFTSIQNAISSSQGNFYVFIDSIDDLNYAVIESDNAVIYLLNKIIRLAFENNNAFFVINSRPYLKINSKDELIAQEFVFEYSQYKTKKDLVYIRTRDFSNEEANEYFAKLNNTKKPPLNTTLLKRLHKKSRSSYKNPLFDYVVGTYYYNHNSELPTDILEIYSYFVNNTINGKFQEENPNGSKFVGKMQDDYRSLLKLIAKEMISYRSKSIDYKFDDEEGTIFSLKRKEPFSIKLSSLKNSTIDLYNKYCRENGSLDKSVYDASVLNCYFFKVIPIRINETLVRFSDDNIMCYLAAESAYNKFYNLIDESFDSIQAATNLEIELADFELHPLSMDFLILLLKKINSDEINKLIFSLKEIIDRFNSSKTISEKEVKAQLIVQIVFVKLYDKSYKAMNSQHFFKSFDKLCKTAKSFEINGQHIDGEHRYLAERYFTQCTFIDCCFRRINLKYYNYKKSKIIQTTFEQCKLDDNIFEESVFKNSYFILCILNNIIFNSQISHDFFADNCKITNCKFQEIGEKNSSEETHLKFKECSIEKLRINNLISPSITISFEKCFVKEIQFENCHYNNCVFIKDCVVENPIKVSCSTLRIIKQRNLIPSSSMLFDIDDKSEVSFESGD